MVGVIGGGQRGACEPLSGLGLTLLIFIAQPFLWGCGESSLKRITVTNHLLKPCEVGEARILVTQEMR